MTKKDMTLTTPKDRLIASMRGDFIKQRLEAFRSRKPFGKPVIETLGDKKREIQWRWYLNHFFFIERGAWADGESGSEYLSLVRKDGVAERELVSAGSNLKPTWRILSVDSATWGENWLEDVEPNEEAVISSMIEFLFARGHIVLDQPEIVAGEMFCHNDPCRRTVKVRQVTSGCPRCRTAEFLQEISSAASAGDAPLGLRR